MVASDVLQRLALDETDLGCIPRVSPILVPPPTSRSDTMLTRFATLTSRFDTVVTRFERVESPFVRVYGHSGTFAKCRGTPCDCIYLLRLLIS
jgi:hypothetical protein